MLSLAPRNLTAPAHPTPPPQTSESPPPPSSAYVPVLAILSVRVEGRGGGFRMPGSPRGFLRLRRPRPGSPASACLAPSQSPQLSPLMPLQPPRQAAAPRCALLPPTCASGGSWAPHSISSSNPLVRLQNRVPWAQGTLPGRTQAQFTAKDRHRDWGWGVVPYTRETGGKQPRRGRRLVPISAWSPSRSGSRGVRLLLLQPTPSRHPGGSPLAPFFPPPTGWSQWYSPQPTHLRSGTRCPRDSSCPSFSASPPSPVSWRWC